MESPHPAACEREGPTKEVCRGGGCQEDIKRKGMKEPKLLDSSGWHVSLALYGHSERDKWVDGCQGTMRSPASSYVDPSRVLCEAELMVTGAQR